MSAPYDLRVMSATATKTTSAASAVHNFELSLGAQAFLRCGEFRKGVCNYERVPPKSFSIADRRSPPTHDSLADSSFVSAEDNDKVKSVVRAPRVAPAADSAADVVTSSPVVAGAGDSAADAVTSTPAAVGEAGSTTNAVTSPSVATGAADAAADPVASSPAAAGAGDYTADTVTSLPAAAGAAGSNTASSPPAASDFAAGLVTALEPATFGVVLRPATTDIATPDAEAPARNDRRADWRPAQVRRGHGSHRRSLSATTLTATPDSEVPARYDRRADWPEQARTGRGSHRRSSSVAFRGTWNVTVEDHNDTDPYHFLPKKSSASAIEAQRQRTGPEELGDASAHDSSDELARLRAELAASAQERRELMQRVSDLEDSYQRLSSGHANHSSLSAADLGVPSSAPLVVAATDTCGDTPLVCGNASSDSDMLLPTPRRLDVDATTPPVDVQRLTPLVDSPPLIDAAMPQLVVLEASGHDRSVAVDDTPSETQLGMTQKLPVSEPAGAEMHEPVTAAGAGFLRKRGYINTSWKWRWFWIENGRLFWSKNAAIKCKRGSASLLGATVADNEREENRGKPFAFFVVTLRAHNPRASRLCLQLQASSDAERVRWKAAIVLAARTEAPSTS